MTIFIILAVLTGFRSSTCQSASYQASGYGNNQYCTKTAYFWTYPEQDPVQNRLMKTTIGGRACEAIQVNVLSRHGARYSSVNDMRAFTSLQQKLSNKFSNQVFTFINDWVNRYPEDKAELQTALGAREMSYLGKFVGIELQSLLNGTVPVDGNLQLARFAATRKTRTQESAISFYSGLSKALNGQDLTNLKPEIRDKVLRFYDDCKRYEKETADLSEQTKFEKGPIFQQIVTDVAKRLGDIKMVYRLCATELAIMNSADWCRLLTDSDREVLEYDNDIEDYITRFYGHFVTGQMSCPLGRDIFTAMDDAITANDQGSSYTKGIFQFGHSDSVIDFAAGLGLFHDSDSLRADNYEAMRNRTFRASILDPFSTHMTFILYSCGGTGIDNYALRLLYNNKPLAFPACSSDVCWFKQVRQSYKQFIDGCDWNSVCSLDHNPNIVG